MEVIMLAVTGVLNIVCFLIGAKVGQTIVNGERLETPTLNPFKAIRDHENRKKAEIEQDKIEKILQNHRQK